MMSSIKPEVHNMSRAVPPEEDRATATGNMHKTLSKVQLCDF